MIFSDTVNLAVRNLREAFLRTVLTSLGVAIGIASLVGMVSFGVALQEQLVGSFLKSGVFDSITVTAGASALGRNLRGRAAKKAPVIPPATRLGDDAVKKLAAIDRVREVYPDLRVPIEVKYGDTSEFTTAAGIPMSVRGEGVFQEITAGRFFRAADADEVILNLDFARRLSDAEPKDLLGMEITLGYAISIPQNPGGDAPVQGAISLQRAEEKFKIVGLLERQTSPGSGLGVLSSVMIPLERARKMGSYDVSSPQTLLRQLSQERTYLAVTVRVQQAQDVEEVEKSIREMGFTAFSIADLLRSQKRAFILLDLLLGLVGSIALTVASLGIVNTMVMSILERTREIGIMKAIGGSDEDVRRIFLVEASLIGMFGGVMGLLLGWLVGRAINLGANYYLQSQGAPSAELFLIPWWLAAGGMAFSIGVSLIAGSFPALRAARLDPIQALRHD